MAKVILVNGSPNEKGCTYTALCAVEKELNVNGIKTEIFHVGKSVSACTACYACAKNKNSRCVIDADSVNRFIEKAEKADGFVFGTPVYFASGAGGMNSFMDRVFFAARSKVMPYKPGAVVASCRRAGSTAALDNMLKYLTISQMPVVTSNYWSMVHGSKPEDVETDLEGMQVMRYIGKNMAWLLKCIEAGKKAGIDIPEQEKKIWTNFVR